MTPTPSTHTTTPPSRRRPPASPAPWWRRPWILPLALFSVTFLLYSIPPYLSLDPADSRLPLPESPSWYFPMLLTHIFGGTLLTLLVILQVWPWLRTRHPAVHRWSGRVYVWSGVPLVGIPALLIAPFSGTGGSAQIGNTVWAVLWLTFTLLGYVMARRRRFAEHREWMLRSFALIYGIAFNRVLLIVLMMIMSPRLETVYGGDLDALGLDVGTASGFLSWVLPLLFVEWWLKYRRRPRRERGPTPRADLVRSGGRNHPPGP